MLKQINILFRKYLGYIILLSLLAFVTYRLLHQSPSTKLLEKELESVIKQKDSIIESEKLLKQKYEDITRQNIYYIKQNVILSRQLREMINDIDDKIKQDEKDILDIDSITEQRADSILSNYKFKPFKIPEN